MTFIPPFPDLDLRYPLSSTAFYNESREISLKRSALLDRRTSATGVSKATSILRAFTAAMDGWLINPTATYTCSAPQPASASLHSIRIFHPESQDSRFPPHDNIPHVRGRLNGGNVFQRNVHQTGERDERSGNVVVPVVVQQHTANEEIDCVVTR